MRTHSSIPEFTIQRASPRHLWGAVVAALLLFALISLPWWAGRSDMRLVVEIACYLALAQLWNLLAGFAGLVSIGQQAWVGLGGYALFVFAVYGGINPLLAVPLAGAVAVLFALPTAFAVFRLRGAYFGIGTWVVAEVYRLSFAQVSALGGGSGMSLPAPIVRAIAADRDSRELAIYWTALAVVVLVMALVYAVMRSRTGLALNALRDSEAASGSLGINTYKAKLGIYLAAAFGTGMVGALIFLQKLRISPDAAFSPLEWGAFVIFIVVIGGIGTLEGPIIGTLIFFALRELLAGFGAWYLVLLGAIATLTMLYAPQGVWGWLAARYDWHVFPLRRRVHLIERK